MLNTEKIPVGVLGATGVVGQRFIALLDDHPWFYVAAVSASVKSEGLLYKDICRSMNEEDLPFNSGVLHLKLLQCEPQEFINAECRLIFSALPYSPSDSTESKFAEAGFFVFSNSRTHRMDVDCPILMPYCNIEQLEVIKSQKAYKDGKGAIITNANCSCTGLVVALKSIYEVIHFEKIYVSTVQAISGAGYNGLSALEIQDNVIPYIENEEVRIEQELRKILGKVKVLSKGKNDLHIEAAEFEVSAMCHRACVSDGHIVTVIIELPSHLRNSSNPDEILGTVRQALKTWEPPRIVQNLPSCPKKVLYLHDDIRRPQPRLDRQRGHGMTVSSGPIQPKYDSKGILVGVKLTTLVHNTILGAAGCAILNAEAALKAEDVIRTPFGNTFSIFLNTDSSTMQHKKRFKPQNHPLGLEQTSTLKAVN